MENGYGLTAFDFEDVYAISQDRQDAIIFRVDLAVDPRMSQ